MAPRGRKKQKVGLMREDAARDAMRAFGFDERVIRVCIKEFLEEQEQQVVDGRDHVSSNSASLVGCGAETDILDSPPVAFLAGEASVIDYASPVAFPSPDASGDYAQHSVGGAKNSGCGWLSEEEETDPDDDSVGYSDEMIPLTPEPLCEELEVLFREIRGEKKRKRVTRWDN